jgi:alpha-1,2-mannosyltransferase
MFTSVEPTAAPAGRHNRRLNPHAASWLMAVIVVGGVLLRAAPWFRANNFTGFLEYDDGVYYAAAKSLLHGLIPYRDFTMVHPPLTWVLLLPAAVAGSLFGDPAGMAAARVEVLLAACVNIWLVRALVQDLVGDSTGRRRAPGYLAAALYAAAPGAVIAGHTVLLETLATLPALFGMRFALRRPLTCRLAALGGVLLACAVGVKLFALAYLVVAATWVLVSAARRLVAFAGGFLGAAFLILGPYLVAAGPSVLWRDLVQAQLTRPSDGPASIGQRLRSLTGLGQLSVGVAIPVLIACATLCFVVLAPPGREFVRKAPQTWVWIGLAVLMAAAFARSPSYFDHYAEFFAGPASIAVGGCVAAAGWAVVPRLAAVLSALVLLTVVGSGSIREAAHYAGQPSLAVATAAVPRTACVYSDSVSLLISADRFTLPSQACPGWIDGRGQKLVWSVGAPPDPHFYPHGFVVDERWQQQTLAQLRSATFLLVRQDPARTGEFGPAVRSYVAHNFRRVWAGQGPVSSPELWERSSARPAW